MNSHQISYSPKLRIGKKVVLSALCTLLLAFFSDNWLLAVFLAVFIYFSLSIGDGTLFRIDGDYLVMKRNSLSKKWSVKNTQVTLIDIEPNWTANLRGTIVVHFREGGINRKIGYGIQGNESEWKSVLSVLEVQKKIRLSKGIIDYFKLK